jgi:hypothetical protein
MLSPASSLPHHGSASSSSNCTSTSDVHGVFTSPSRTLQQQQHQQQQHRRTRGERRTFVQTLTLGFVVGLASASMFLLMHRVNTEFETIGLAYDSAIRGGIPPIEGEITKSMNNNNDVAFALTKDNNAVNHHDGTKSGIDIDIGVVGLESTTTTTSTIETANQAAQASRDTASMDESSSELVPPPPTTATTAEAVVSGAETTEKNSVAATTVATLSNNSFVYTGPIKEFERQERVVIATKIHGDDKFNQLQQSLCLLHYAYNHKVLYDIVVFASIPLSDTNLEELKRIVAPATLTVVVDNPGIVEMVQAMTPERQAHLLQRCIGGNGMKNKKITSEHQLTWHTKCKDPMSGSIDPISYNWQAEFRTLHIWTHPALANYKYMMWLDSDGFCTKVWDRDPIAIMMQRKLVLLFDHFPGGRSRGAIFQTIFQQAFGHGICSIEMTSRATGGQLYHTVGNCLPQRTAIKQVHGFFHLTDLDFYRSDPVMKWSRALIGDSKFSRQLDDQIGVTVPAAVYASNQTAEMEAIGINLDIFHNGLLDGKRRTGQQFEQHYWPEGKTKFPEAVAGQCNVINQGR